MTTIEYQLDTLEELIELRHKLRIIFTKWRCRFVSNYKSLELKLEIDDIAR